jgi:hypothetical protein
VAIETDAGRLLFLQDFGSTVTTPGGDCLGITDTEYVDTHGIDNATEALICRTSDVLALMPKGTLITIDGTAYRVRTHKPDGNGMSVVVLSDP